MATELFSKRAQPPHACPHCAQEPEHVEQLFRDPPPPGPDTRRPLLERYRHPDGRVCQLRIESGKPKWDELQE